MSTNFIELMHLVPPRKVTQATAVSDSGGGGLLAVAFGVLVVLVVLGLLGYVAMRFWQRKDEKEEAENKYLARRVWAWELVLTDAEEDALLRGLQGWETAERSLYLGHEDGTMTLYLPGRQVLVSLFMLGERFRAAGAQTEAVGPLLDTLAAQPQPGVISFSESWFAVGQLDGMDHDAFLSKVRDTLTTGLDNGLPGSNGWYSDENYGRIDLRLVAEPSSELQRLQSEERFDLVPMAESKVKNVLLFNAGPLVERYQQQRAAQPSASAEEILRTLLVSALAQPDPQVFTWSRGAANPHELALVQASAAGRTSLD